MAQTAAYAIQRKGGGEMPANLLQLAGKNLSVLLACANCRLQFISWKGVALVLCDFGIVVDCGLLMCLLRLGYLFRGLVWSCDSAFYMRSGKRTPSQACSDFCFSNTVMPFDSQRRHLPAPAPVRSSKL